MSRQVLEAPQQSGAEVRPVPGDVFVLPCSVSQERFWLLEQISPGNTALLIPIALRLRGPLQVEALEEAMQAIAARHEILRTHFALVGETPKQIIADKICLKLHRLDLGDIPESQREQRIVQAMADEADRPISLDQDSLLRATLVTLGANDHVLMLTAHHIISDGWSSGVLVRELSHLYDAIVKHKTSSLPLLTIQYADYVLWQDEWLKSPELDRQLVYWQDHLRDLPVLDLPTDFMRTKAQAHEAVLESLLLPQALTDSLKEFCRAQGVTLFMVLYSAYLVLLHRYSGQEALLLGTTGANRNRPELEQLVGLFANILLLRADVPGRKKFSDFLREQRTELLEGFAHSEAPLERVLEQVSRRKSGATRVHLQTHFLFQKAFMQAAESGGLDIKPLYSVSPGSTFELAFGIVERTEGIRLQMEYRTSLFQRGTVVWMLRHFQALLESIVADADLPIEDLSLFSGAERDDEEARIARALAHPADQSFQPEMSIADLDRHLDLHLQSRSSPFCPVAELPPGVTLVALDRKQRLLPVGIVGALYLAFDREKGSALVSSSVSSPEPSFRDYGFISTGFQGRRAETGSIELWGHAEDLVRLSDFRFNRRMVAARLLLHSGVKAAQAFVQEKTGRLIAFVVAQPGVRLGVDDLLDFLRGELSEFILPVAVVLVAQLPDEATARAWLPATNDQPSGAVKAVPLQGVVPAQLKEIWENILSVPDIGLHDDFFDLGGNSFLALRMMKEAEKITGQALPLSLLFAGATIEELSRSLIALGSHDDAHRDLVSIQATGSRPPVFFLHGDWVGGGLYCRKISRELGADQPFFALPPYRSADGLPSLAQMARHHIAAIRTQVPKGPYVIGGYCIGALVALEVARQLRTEGEEITRLLLVDPPFWPDPWPRAAWPWIDRLGRMRGWTLAQKIGFFDRHVVALQRSLRHPLNLVKLRWNRLLRHEEEAGGSAATSVPRDAESDKVLDGPEYSSYFLAYRLHRVGPLSVPTSIFFSESTSAARISGLPGIGKIDSTLAVLSRIPGDHTTCVTQDVSSLGAQMRAALGFS